jgi:hypothetical protein
MSKSSLVVIEGLKAFTGFLRSEGSRFSSAPVLLIASQGKNDKAVEEACQRASFIFQQQMGFRTVVFHSTAQYSFPTLSDVEQATALAARVGASTVAAVGSGSSIDLAKAVYQSKAQHDIEEIVLLPSTPCASIAAASSCSLLFDPVEESLVAHPSLASEGQESRTVALIDQKVASSKTNKESLYACIGLALDNLLRDDEDENTANLIADCVRLLETPSDESIDPKEVTRLLLQAGEGISFGLDGNTRSLPIALAAGLIPTDFAQYSTLTFLASLAPSVFQEVHRKNAQSEVTKCVAQHNFDGAPRSLTTESMRTLLSHIHANQSLWGCDDVRDDVIRRVLQDHVVL